MTPKFITGSQIQARTKKDKALNEQGKKIMRPIHDILDERAKVFLLKVKKLYWKKP